jgi:hypothetical protein
MAQTNYTPISLYYSTTASAVPTAANLVPGELAINTNDGKLYYEDSSGVVQVLATKSTGSIGGSNTQVQFNNSGSLGGSSGLTWDGSFLTTSSIKNSALTSGRVTYAGASGLLSDSATLTYNGTTLTATTGANFCTTSGSVGIGTSSPATFSVGGTPVLVVGNNAQTQITLYGGSNVGDINFATSSSGAGLYSGVVRYDGTSNFMSFWTSSTERMRINSSGNLGLGVTPSAWATVVPVLQFLGGASLAGFGNVGYLNANAYFDGSWRYIASAASGRYEVADSHKWFSAASGTAGNAISYTQAMTLDTSGNLLVGKTSTSFSTAGMNFTAGGLSELVASSSTVVAVNRLTTDGDIIDFYRQSSKVGSISVTTLLTTYNTTSDYRLKIVTNAVTGQGERIDALKPIDYQWKESNQQARGFLAHEFQTVYPNSVTGEKDDVDADGKPVYQTMQASTAEVIADLVAEIQSLRQRITNLENK